MLRNPVSVESMLTLKIAESYYRFKPELRNQYNFGYLKRIMLLQKAILRTMAQGLFAGLSSDESREDILVLCARFHREDMTGIPIFKEFKNE